jgi:membrane fusion protein (multidrug efflux system)
MRIPSAVFIREGIMNRIFGLLAALAILGGCARAKEAPAPQTPEVSVVSVRKASVPVVTELPGRTSAYLVARASTASCSSASSRKART